MRLLVSKRGAKRTVNMSSWAQSSSQRQKILHYDFQSPYWHILCWRIYSTLAHTSEFCRQWLRFSSLMTEFSCPRTPCDFFCPGRQVSFGLSFITSLSFMTSLAFITSFHPCVPLAIKTIMIVLFKILTLFHFKAIRSSWLTLNESLIVSMAKGTQCTYIVGKIPLVFAPFMRNSQRTKTSTTIPATMRLFSFKSWWKKFEFFVFWVFLHDPNESKDVVWTRLNWKVNLSREAKANLKGVVAKLFPRRTPDLPIFGSLPSSSVWSALAFPFDPLALPSLRHPC